MLRTLSLLLAALSALLFTTVAAAQATLPPPDGFALNRFDISEAGSDWFAGDSLDFRGGFRPGLRLAVDWAHRPLVRYDADGKELEALIANQAHVHLGLSFIIAERLRIAGSLPVLAFQDGEQNPFFTLQDGGGVGDLRLSGDLRVVGEYRDPFSLALGAQFHVPTGDRAAFTGDENIRIQPRLMIAGDLGPIAYSARVGYDYRPHDAGLGPISTGSELSFVTTLGLRAVDGKLLIGPEFWGTTVVSDADAIFKDRSTPLELLLGLHYKSGDWNFGIGGGPGLSRGLGSPAVRVVSSLTFIPNADDRDKDGILDEDDACPDLAGPPHDDPKRHGCPDRDGDDIIDPVDACPDVPGVADADPNKHGCPLGDRDGDGITDDDDACPDQAGPPRDDPEEHGCPDRDEDGIIDLVDACPDVRGIFDPDPEKNGCPPDRDGDGIYDYEDACPDEPGVASDDPEKHGCPPDRDGDGIYDQDDACPDEPGVASDDPEKHGCPIAIVRDKQIKILQRIEFETNKAKIRQASEVVLEAVLQILQEHPEIEQVRVEGHTDNVGRAAYNRRLSQKRAASVVRWLVNQGIDRSRLLAKGLGLTQPIADNGTAVGRQTNRRVEFHIARGEVTDVSSEADADAGSEESGDGGDDYGADDEASSPPRTKPADDDDDPLRGL